MNILNLKIDLEKMSKEEIDTAHRKKRKQNIQIAVYIIYSLIFAFSVSLGHSLVTIKENMILEKQVEALTEQIIELEQEKGQ